MNRPAFISPVAYRGWFAPTRLNKFARIAPKGQREHPGTKYGTPVYSFLQQRTKELDPVTTRQGKYRLVDVHKKAEMLGYKLITPHLKDLELHLLEPWVDGRKRELDELILDREYRLESLDILTTDPEELDYDLLLPEVLIDRAIDPVYFSGIYFLIREGVIVYTGQSVNVFARIQDHLRDNTKVFDKVSYVRCPKDSLDVVENLYIGMLKPEYNIRHKSVCALDLQERSYVE